MNGQPDVPAGWKAVFNNEHQEWFYVNIYTKASTWDKPTKPPPSNANPFGDSVSSLGYSDKVVVLHSDLEVNQSAYQPVQEFYGGQSSSNGFHQTSATQDEKYGPALEEEILNEYSYEAGSTTASAKASAFSLNKRCKVMIKRYTKTDESEIARANREIRALQAIQDRSVPPLLDYFDPADTIFVVLEDREDESLKRYIEGRGSLSEDMLKSVVTQLFSGLAEIFCAGFVHLGINDETLFIDKTGQICIKDFEYAHPYVTEKDGDLYAAVEVRYGSDIYTPPEVFTTSPYNGRKAVMWSCGVAIYYMTTGQTERLSNLEHPFFAKPGAAPLPTPTEEAISPQRRRSSLGGFRRQSQGGRKVSISQPPNIVTYPGSRFEVTNWVRDIVSKMLITNPLKRAELIEVAAKVPKEVASKITRPLMEQAWNDYKLHVGPHAGLENPFETNSYASSMYSGISSVSNPFASLISGRRNSAKATTYGGFV